MDCSNLKPGNTGGEALGEAEVMVVEECGTKRKRVESDDSPASRGSTSAVEELKAKIRKDELDASLEEEEAAETYRRYLWEGVDMKGVPLRRFLSLMRWAVDLHKADIEAGVDTQQSKKLPYKRLAEAYAERVEESWRWQLAFYRLLRESNHRHIEARDAAIAMLVEEQDLEVERASERTALKQEVESLRLEKEKAVLNLASAEAGVKEKEETLSKEREVRTELEGRCRRLTVELDQLKLRRKQEEELRRKEPQRAPKKMVEASTNTEAREEDRGERIPARPGVDAATSTEDMQGETEVNILPPQVGVDPGLLKAIDAIVVRRLREMGGSSRGGPEGIGEPSAASPFPSAGEGTWAQKVGRKARKRSSGAPPPSSTPGRGKGAVEGTKARRSGPGANKRTEQKAARKWPTLPKTAAVTLTIPPGVSTSYAEVLEAARKEIPLEELGIPHVQVRRTRTGGLILGVPGEDSKAKADRLADRLSTVVAASGVRVARPSRRLDLRVAGLDVSVATKEVVAAVAEAGGCREEEVRCGRSRGPSTVAWVQCPMVAALQIARSGGIKVGWIRATVELLPVRPLRCHRCLELGHVRAQCGSSVSREA